MWLWICNIVTYNQNPEKFFYKCKLSSDYFDSPINFENFVNYEIIDNFWGQTIHPVAFEKYPWLEKLWFFDLHWQDKIFYSVNFLLDKIIFFGIIFAIFWIIKTFWNYFKKPRF